MTMHIIQDFRLWKSINEDELPSREKEKKEVAGDTNKVVVIPIDNNSFKVKIVHGESVLVNGKLTDVSFANILGFIKNQDSIISYYNNLTEFYTVNANNTVTLNKTCPFVIIYSVAKSNDRKQVLLFKIVRKSMIQQKNPQAFRMLDNVLYMTDQEFAAGGPSGGIVSGGSGASGNTETKTEVKKIAGLTLPIKGASINGSTNAALIEFITKAYNAVKAKITGNPILPKVKEEIKASLLGVNSQTFVKALNAGFSIMDAKFGEDVEDDITSTLVAKIEKPDELNVTLFGNVAAPAAKIDTGDIQVPADGFRGGMQKNAELKKFQDLMKTKLATKLRDHKTYQDFVKSGKKGFVGNYGPLTANLVTLLKTIAKPPYPNQNGNIIEPQLVSMIRAINESAMYLALDGFTLITEEDMSFDFTAAPNYSPTVSDSGEVASSSNGVVRKKVASSYAAKPKDFNVKAFQEWLINTKKESGWSSKDADGSWGPKTAGAYTKYKDTYKPVKSSGSAKDQAFDTVLNKIITKFRTGLSGFNRGTWKKDDIDGAFQEVKRMWTKDWSLKLSDYKKDGDNYYRLNKMFSDDVMKSSLYQAMDRRDDEFTFMYRKENGESKFYKIPTDF